MLRCAVSSRVRSTALSTAGPQSLAFAPSLHQKPAFDVKCVFCWVTHQVRCCCRPDLGHAAPRSAAPSTAGRAGPPSLARVSAPVARLATAELPGPSGTGAACSGPASGTRSGLRHGNDHNPPHVLTSTHAKVQWPLTIALCKAVWGRRNM